MGKTMRRRVLFLTYHLPMPEEPGAFRPWMEARLIKNAGFEVTVVTCGTQYMTGKDIRPARGWCTEEVTEGIRILKTWAPADHRQSLFRRVLNYSSFSLLAGVASFLKAGKVDRVFAGTDPIFLMPMVFLISLIKRAPMVLDERDLFPETAVALGVIRDGILYRILLGMQNCFRRMSSGILAATPGIKRVLLDYGCLPEKVQLLYNADVFFDEDLRKDESPETLRKATGREFLVGYAGGLGRANDIPVLLRAAALLNDLADIGIVVMGSGERQQIYKDYCRKNRLNNVSFFDAIPRKEARQLLREMDVCIQPLPRHPYFSRTLTSKTFDYHGLGKPMIFCGSGDTVALLEDSGGGVVVEPEDEEALAQVLRKLHSDALLRLEMGASARRWFETNVNVHAASEIVKKAMNGQQTASVRTRASEGRLCRERR